MKKKYLFFLLFGFSSFCFSQNFINEDIFYVSEKQSVSLKTLLDGFKESNKDYQKAVINYKKTLNSITQSDLSIQPSYSIATGSSKIVFDSEQGTYLEMNPNASVSLPTLNNLSVNLKMPSTLDNQGYYLNGTDVSASFDIFSKKNFDIKLNAIQNEHSIIVAKQNLDAQNMSCEQQFYSDLISLFDKAYSVLQKREDYQTKLKDFESTKLQGYGTTSSVYKIALMQKDFSYNECQKAYKDFKSELLEFGIKCGVQLDSLIYDIPDVGLISFEDFSMDDYKKIQEANYSKQSALLKKEREQVINLSGTLNYNFSQSRTTQDSHSVGAGLKTDFSGVELGLGVAFPINSEKQPSLTFNASFNSNTNSKSKLDSENICLDLDLQEINVQEAYENYLKDKQVYLNKYQNLEWENSLLNEQKKYYSQLEKEFSSAYKKGLISESEYVKTQNQCENIKINLLKNILNKYKFNLEVQQLFYVKEN